MAKLEWSVVHECDDEESGDPTCWSAEINHQKFGKYCWINDIGAGFVENGFNVEVKTVDTPHS